MSRIDSFEAMLAGGQDGALLRYSLGREYIAADDAASAIGHLEQAVAFDPGYSAAWKALGQARDRAGDPAAAIEAWARGIAAAETRGDKQAAKEMQVFIRRAEKKRQ